MANLANQPFWAVRVQRIFNKFVPFLMVYGFFVLFFNYGKKIFCAIINWRQKRNVIKTAKQIENVMVLLRTLSKTTHYKNRKIVIRNKFDDPYSKIIQKLKMNQIAYTIREGIIFIKNNESALIKIKIKKNKFIIWVNKKGKTNLQYKLT